MLPDLNRLKVFYVIFAFKSIAMAARELHITASAVSQSLSKLETELTVRLFTRLHRKLIPTSAGKDLFHLVAPFVQGLEAGIGKIIQSKQVPSGMLRIGAPIEFGKSYFPGLFADFRRIYPQVVFTMKLGDPSEIFSMISSGELDFGLVDIFFTRGRDAWDIGIYSSEPLVEERVILACSKRYYDREIQGDHSFENLVGKEFISYQKTSLTLRTWFKYHFNRFSIDLNRVMTVDSHQAVINGILNHVGMGIVAAHIVGSAIDSGLIMPVATPKQDVINKISLVQLQDKVPSLTEKTFIRFLTADIKSSDGAIQLLGPS
jgi:DNA-binding transcriptional LysR family regulator